MEHRKMVVALLLALVFPGPEFFSVWHAEAGQVQVNAGSVNMFRDTRGDNDVGLAPGDRLQFGANVIGGSAGATLGACYPPPGFSAPQFPCNPLTTPPTGFTVSQLPCDPIAVNQNFCARTTAFNANRLSRKWIFRFEKPGFDSLIIDGPLLSVNGESIKEPVPFPKDVTISGSGLTPRISWTLKDGFVPDGVRIQIFDKDRPSPIDGSADIIHSVAVSATDPFYDIPAKLSNPLGIPLRFGGQYSINFQLVETRDHVTFTNNNAQILRRSNSFFAFTPLDNSAPPNVALPTVINGVYHFDHTEVGPDFVKFIDPPIAIGYDYAIGTGDPTFASVLLPDVGDGRYNLYTCDGLSLGTAFSGVSFNLGPGGLSCFRVRGIETSAGLDPKNVTAFITGLTFVENGTFTGTMTPILYGDQNGDRIIDITDVNIVTNSRNQPASGPDDPRDLNHDGVINALDSRVLVTLCTNPRCAVQP